MRGPINTQVKLKVERPGRREPLEFTLTRSDIVVPAVRARMEGEDVGYIRISTFSEQTFDGLRRGIEQAMRDAPGDKLKGFVIDLRNNRGGRLDQAVLVSDAFLERGEIVSTRGRNPDETQRYNARSGDLTRGKPVIVLINGGSASAAEIVAGAIQDHKRGTVMGTRSFGKGSVQTIIPLGQNGALRLTTARYYTPSGRSIQARGIDPDTVILQDVPEELRGRDETRGEAGLRGHLSSGQTNEERSGSSSYIPPDKTKDNQLNAALDLLRGVKRDAANQAPQPGQPQQPPRARTEVSTRRAPRFRLTKPPTSDSRAASSVFGRPAAGDRRRLLRSERSAWRAEAAAARESMAAPSGLGRRRPPLRGAGGLRRLRHAQARSRWRQARRGGEDRAGAAPRGRACARPGPVRRRAAAPASQRHQMEEEAGVRVVRPGSEAPNSVVIRVPDAPAIRLAAAPDRRLVERHRHGSLPKIGEDGTRPAQLYARPLPQLPEGPRIAILVGGLGISANMTAEAIQRLPGEVSFAFAPYGSELERQAGRARADGHEIFIQAPMEPFDYPDNDPGPHTLTATASAEENLDRLRWVMARLPGYVGVVNFMGARFASSEQGLVPVVQEISQRGLLLVDDGSSGRSLMLQTAAALRAPALRADIVLDAAPRGEAIDRELARLEQLARERGLAFATASALPPTVDRLQRWAGTLAAKGIRLVPVSAIPQLRAQTTGAIR